MSTSFSPPPIRHNFTTQVSQSRALDLISAYLEATKTSTEIAYTHGPHTLSDSGFASKHPTQSATPSGAALHPDAVLTEAGPVAPAGGAAGLVLRNLERVRAGLKGEIWAAEPDEAGMGGAREEEKYPMGGSETERVKEGEEGESVEDGWQAKEDFEREQEQEVSIREEDITGKEVPRVTAPPVRMGNGAGLLKQGDMESRVDKDTRKKLKKERKLQQRRMKEAMRGKESAAGE